jgi:hypothetical protein
MGRRGFIIWLIGAASAWPLIAWGQSPAAGEKRGLSLIAAQRSEIWHALRKQARKTQEPAGLNIGDVVPATMNLLSFGHNLRKKIPAIRLYQYTLLHDRVLIVDPGTKKIIAIIGH